MRLHEELDAQPQPTGSHVIHLLADAVPQIQPQVLAFAASELQPEVVHLNYAQLSANLGRDERPASNKVDFREREEVLKGDLKTAWERLLRGHGKSLRQEKLFSLQLHSATSRGGI